MEKLPDQPESAADQEAKAEAVRNAGSFEELFEAIRSYGPVQGSKREYQPEEVIKRIEYARVIPNALDEVTNGGDLMIRKKVRQLIQAEQSPQE